MLDRSQTQRVTPYLHKKPSSLRYFQEGPAPIDIAHWRLDVRGEVRTSLSLTLDDIREFSGRYHHRRTVCVCLWTIKRHWFGVPLRSVLEAAGVDLNDDDLFLLQLSNGTDKGRYDSTIHLRSAVEREAILAFGADDAPLTLETGYPLRLIDFGLYKYKCVKALRELIVTRKNELGYWEAYAGYDLDGTVQPKKYYAVDLQRKIWFALATSATPGPVNIISAMTGASFGPLRSIPYVMGATTSFVAIMLLLGLGLGEILEWVDRFSLALTVAGSGYMLWLAYRIAGDRGELQLDRARERRPGFKAGLITQGVNPKAWIVSLSAISIYVAPHIDYNSRLAMFAAIFFVICAASLAVWAVVGFRIARTSGDISTFNKVMAGLLTISVLMILIEKFRTLAS